MASPDRQIVSSLLRQHRAATVELLQDLDDDRWATQSLCRAWTVRDVAAHLAWQHAVRPTEMIPGLVRARGRMNAFVADVARTWARRDRDAILAQLRDNVETGVTPPGVPRLAPLADAVLHGLDIRIPLGRSVPVDHESFVLLADWFTGLRGPAAMLLGGSTKRRLTGVRVVAEDLDCAYGTGAEARGRSDVVLAALGGRSVPADSLSGPGAGLLRSRLPAPAAGTEKPDLR